MVQRTVKRKHKVVGKKYRKQIATAKLRKVARKRLKAVRVRRGL